MRWASYEGRVILGVEVAFHPNACHDRMNCRSFPLRKDDKDAEPKRLFSLAELLS
jgi:hypothetical protein